MPDTPGRGLAAPQIRKAMAGTVLPLIDGERADDFAALREGVMAHFAVADPLAEALADHLAAILWRLKRLPRFEQALIAWTRHQQARRHDDGVLRAGPIWVTADPRALAPDDSPADAPRERRWERDLGRSLEVLLVKNDVLGKLCRYEAHLVRQAEALIRQLRK